MSFRFIAVALLLFTLSIPAAAGQPPAQPAVSVPILLYHRFGPTVADGMTIKTSVFEEHLKYLRDNGYKVIPLRQLVNWYQKKGPAPAPKSVVIVEDDAHKSVYTDMFPLAKKYNVPVTVFIYPSAVSNAKYAMTWDQLRDLKKSGLFDFQSHTFWHPNFKKDRKKMSPAEFDKSTTTQLTKSKARIEKELGVTVDLLAWPFGIYNDDLLRRAAAAGYIGTFTIERRHATAAESLTKLPRYLLINADQGKSFAQILAGNAPKRDVVY
jgi:peptidoglycan/xylan/chitin deacetylase (PgdA/CDA1 family)